MVCPLVSHAEFHGWKPRLAPLRLKVRNYVGNLPRALWPRNTLRENLHKPANQVNGVCVHYGPSSLILREALCPVVGCQ